MGNLALAGKSVIDFFSFGEGINSLLYFIINFFKILINIFIIVR